MRANRLFLVSFFLILSLFSLSIDFLSAQEKTIKVFYPSPYGEYENLNVYSELRAEHAAIGHNYMDGTAIDWGTEGGNKDIDLMVDSELRARHIAIGEGYMHSEDIDWDGQSNDKPIDLRVEKRILVGDPRDPTDVGVGLGINTVPEFSLDIVGRSSESESGSVARLIAGWAPFDGNQIAGFLAGHYNSESRPAWSNYIGAFFNITNNLAQIATDQGFLLVSMWGTENQVDTLLGGFTISGQTMDGIAIFHGDDRTWRPNESAVGLGSIGEGDNAYLLLSTGEYTGSVYVNENDNNGALVLQGKSGSAEGIILTTCDTGNNCLASLRLQTDGTVILGSDADDEHRNLVINNDVLIGNADTSRDRGLTVTGDVIIGNNDMGTGSLTVQGEVAIGDNDHPHNLFVSGSVTVGAEEPGGASGVVINGNLSVGTENVGNRQFTVHGDATITQTLSVSNIQGADIAEYYPVEKDVEAGDVVVVGRDGDRLIKSHKAYSMLVAGIVSESPGIVIAAQEDGSSKPIALKGRVPCKVVGEGGPISRGDILVTSSRPGYAMKGDPDKIKLATQVVGIALEDFDGQEGRIKVLVK